MNGHQRYPVNPRFLDLMTLRRVAVKYSGCCIEVFETSKSPPARTEMDKIAVLYGIEAGIRRPPDERLRV